MDNEIIKLYRDFRKHSPFMQVGSNAKLALESARTLQVFRNYEMQGKVSLIAEHEEDNYFDVYGEPGTDKERQSIINSIETYGLHYVQSQAIVSCNCCGGVEHEHADGIGMCCYENPLCPFENCHVIGLMQSAIDLYESNN